MAMSNFVPFPDYHEELEWLVGDGDFVAWRSRGRGTQMGAFGPFPASGKQMDLVIIGMHRFEGHWSRRPGPHGTISPR